MKKHNDKPATDEQKAHLERLAKPDEKPRRKPVHEPFELIRSGPDNNDAIATWKHPDNKREQWKREGGKWSFVYDERENA